jgi:serine phosphatase RsbU (regulator of sigma subunit)
VDYTDSSQSSPKFHSVSRRFSYTFISVVSLLLFVFATIAIFVNITRIKTALQNRLDNIVELSSVSLEQALWNFDTNTVDRFVGALLLDTSHVYADVVGGGEVFTRKIRPPWQDKDFVFFAQSPQFLVKTADIAHEGRIVGTIRLAISRDSIQNEVRLNIVGILALTLCIIIAIFLTSIVITRRYIARPLATLQHSATLIAQGDLEAPIAMHSRDEIGLLAQDFSAMRDALKQLVEASRDSQTQLEEYNRTLEHRVAERTEQLAQANTTITGLNAQLQADNLRMGAELEVTRKLQHMLLPTAEELRQIADLDIACYMEPAAEVGGDYYDILQHNGQIKIGIGDVTGHGLESGVLMVMTQAIVRALLMSGETDPVHFLDTLNRVLYGNMQRMGTDKNLTLSLLDYVAGDVRLSGQHETMLVVRDGGMVEVVDTMDLGFPVALTDEIADFIQHITVRLQPGDGVVLYTDGITEAEDVAGQQYGLKRLCRLVSQHWSAPAEVIKERVVADVHQHMGAQTMYDDITLVVVKRR